MQSTFSGIEIGKRSLFAHQVGIHTIGHNFANIETEGYSRQRVSLRAQDPLYPTSPTSPASSTAGQIGQGVIADRVTRVRDQFVENRIVASTSDLSYWETRDKHLLSIERVYNEPGEYTIRGQLDRFWTAWQDLSLRPHEGANRQAVLESSKSLVASFTNTYVQFDQLKNIFDDEINAAVVDINSLSEDIGRLNVEISKQIAAGTSPNDLLDRRDAKVAELAQYVQVSTGNRDSDDYTVYSQGSPLVQGGRVRRLEAIGDPALEGFSRVVWADTRQDFDNPSGTLHALTQLRDGDLQQEIDRLDTFTINFIDLVNEVHRAGYGADGRSNRDFFVELPRVLNVNGNFDSTGDGAFDSTYLFRVNGSNQLNAEEQIGIAGTITLPGTDNDTVEVLYNPTDTVEQVITRINQSGAEIVSRLNRDNQLQLKATTSANNENPDFVLRSFSDSGQFLVDYAGILAGSGVENSYNWQQANAGAAFQQSDYAVAPLLHPAGWVAINPQVANSPLAVATGFPGSTDTPGTPPGASDGSAAQAIAQIRNNPVLIGSAETIDDYFAEGIASLGLSSRYADIFKETHADIVKGLVDMRDSISGVNIDEEVAELIKFQHGYAAAARFVSNIDQMLDTIINRMGV